MKKKTGVVLHIVVVVCAILALGMNYVEAAEEPNEVINVENNDEVRLEINGEVIEQQKCRYESGKVILDKENLTANDYNQTTHIVTATLKIRKHSDNQIMNYIINFKDSIPPNGIMTTEKNYNYGTGRVDSEKVTIKCNEDVIAPSGWDKTKKREYDFSGARKPNILLFKQNILY